VVRKIPSGSHLTEMLALICSASLRWQTPKTNPANRKYFSAGPTVCHPDSPCLDSFRTQSAHWFQSSRLDLLFQKASYVRRNRTSALRAVRERERPQTHRANGTRESDLGTSTRVSGAVGQAGYLCFSTKRFSGGLAAPVREANRRAPYVHRRLRFPGRGDRSVSNSLCVPPDGGRDTAHRALQRHRASNGSLDLAAAS
jgi:hypothetical protein